MAVIQETLQVLHVIGGGLAGSEAAWQAAERGIQVVLWEMRPRQQTPAHVTSDLAELVCSNSLGSDLPDRASGLLKNELRRLGSLIMSCADQTRVPAGGALAVDREAFARLVTSHIEHHPRITLRREEARRLPEGPTIVASGPLTSSALADDIGRLIGADYLYFYDALSPIVSAESIDMQIAFRGSRYQRGEAEDGDYINCPMSADEYRVFVEALVSAEHIELRDFEREDPHFFEGCLPVEQIALRGFEALAFGPLRPVGLTDPHTGRRPYAIVQLRQDNLAGTLHNMVGFQTNLRWPEQARVFRMIPGLRDAQFVRYGQMHRNTYINSPLLLHATMQYRRRPDLFFAGQITGIEGYVGNAGSGFLAGINAANLLRGDPLWTLPQETMLGALAFYVSHADPDTFQPMKANFGILPQPDAKIRSKRDRYTYYADRALKTLDNLLMQHRLGTLARHDAQKTRQDAPSI